MRSDWQFVRLSQGYIVMGGEFDLGFRNQKKLAQTFQKSEKVATKNSLIESHKTFVWSIRSDYKHLTMPGSQ